MIDEKKLSEAVSSGFIVTIGIIVLSLTIFIVGFFGFLLLVKVGWPIWAILAVFISVSTVFYFKPKWAKWLDKEICNDN